jgi:hypothetical protein
VVGRENGTAEDALLEEREVIEALGALEPVWAERFPAGQTRIVKLLVERVDVQVGGLKVRLRAEGLTSLVVKLRQQPVPAQAA